MAMTTYSKFQSNRAYLSLLSVLDEGVKGLFEGELSHTPSPRRDSTKLRLGH